MDIRNASKLVLRCYKGFRSRPFFDSTLSVKNGRRFASSSSSNNKDKKVDSGGGDIRDMDAYRDLDKLDFNKAYKILFQHPPRRKKFGIDFHLVQLFFACLPSLAVYLVAQYARHEKRKLDAELDRRRKAEEDKLKEEADAAEEKLRLADSQLSEVKERLVALEKTVNEIVVEPRKQPKPTGDGVAAKHQQPPPPPPASDPNNTRK